MMPRITTDSGKTLDQVIGQQDLFATEPATTRKGDSIVPATTHKGHSIAQARMDWVHAFHREYYSVAPPQPFSHRNDPPTSTQAARSMVQGAQHHRVAILTALRLFGPATGHELAARLGMEYVQVAKRLTELHAAGSIKRRIYGSHDAMHEWGTYQTRPSPSGRPACVWHLNPLAKSTEPA